MELTAQKLLSQNISEALIDKQPRRKRDEILANVAPRHRVDPTMAAAQYQRLREKGRRKASQGTAREKPAPSDPAEASAPRPALNAPAACRERGGHVVVGSEAWFSRAFPSGSPYWCCLFAPRAIGLCRDAQSLIAEILVLADTLEALRQPKRHEPC